MNLPREASRILNEGRLCYLAAPSRAGPHLTPVVFVLDGGRVWGTTGRATTKAKLWRRNPVAGGGVAWDGAWLAFRGGVTLYDALDPSTWGESVRRAPRVASASVRFSIKNARFFAGYARDATRVPLAWTPPGRVIFSVDLSAVAIHRQGQPVERWGSWGGAVAGLSAYRRATPGLSPDELPADIGELVGASGEGTLAVSGRGGAAVLPARWTHAEGAFFAVMPTRLLDLADPLQGAASLVIDRASAWRAARMRGVLLRGPASVYVPSKLRSGRRELEEVTGLADDEAVVRIRPRSAVWWVGWASGTVRRP